MIKVLIADDQELIRQSLQIVLDSKPDIEVTDVAADGAGRWRICDGCRERRRKCLREGGDGWCGWASGCVMGDTR